MACNLGGRQQFPGSINRTSAPGSGIANRLINPQPQQPQGSIFFPQEQQVTPLLPVYGNSFRAQAPGSLDRPPVEITPMPPVEITPMPPQPVTPTLPVINDPQKRFKPRRIMPF
jgi:hypothetical protein